jgi:hypothetical protein
LLLLLQALEDLYVHYDCTVRNAAGSIVQLSYGDDGLDPVLMEGKNGAPLDFEKLLAKVCRSLCKEGGRMGGGAEGRAEGGVRGGGGRGEGVPIECLLTDRLRRPSVSNQPPLLHRIEQPAFDVNGCKAGDEGVEGTQSRGGEGGGGGRWAVVIMPWPWTLCSWGANQERRWISRSSCPRWV